MTASFEIFANSLRYRRNSSPITVPHVIAGVEFRDGQRILREDPSKPSFIVSSCHEAPDHIVQRAVVVSRSAQREWQAIPLADRIARMRPALAHIEASLDNWAVRIALEIGKSQDLAIAEGREVLDILRLYLGYAEQPGLFDDERTGDTEDIANASLLRPYGVFGVIAPFNFPVVQAANAVIAALLTGNGAVVKTSHQAPWSGQAVYEMCAAMDLPQGLVNIVHGADEAGRALSASEVDGISFTGSVAVGTSILRHFASGAYPRPVIAEMGGKNPLIVTDTADLEAAAEGIMYSAFDFGGQKCSALSRVLVTDGSHDRLVELVREGAAKLAIGDPTNPGKAIGPLVDARALARFEKIVAEARTAGFEVTGGERSGGEGYFVTPAVVSGIAADHPLSVTEHFVPFLTISKVASFDEAIGFANETAMGLTAGIYTGLPEEGRDFLRRIEAGCVNVNVPGHATTGWWPGPQTFGGWKGSGSSGKQAHGRWYILQFGRQQSRKVSTDMMSLLRA